MSYFISGVNPQSVDQQAVEKKQEKACGDEKSAIETKVDDLQKLFADLQQQVNNLSKRVTDLRNVPTQASPPPISAENLNNSVQIRPSGIQRAISSNPQSPLKFMYPPTSISAPEKNSPQDGKRKLLSTTGSPLPNEPPLKISRLDDVVIAECKKKFDEVKKQINEDKIPLFIILEQGIKKILEKLPYPTAENEEMRSELHVYKASILEQLGEHQRALDFISSLMQTPPLKKYQEELYLIKVRVLTRNANTDLKTLEEFYAQVESVKIENPQLILAFTIEKAAALNQRKSYKEAYGLLKSIEKDCLTSKDQKMVAVFHFELGHALYGCERYQEVFPEVVKAQLKGRVDRNTYVRSGYLIAMTFYKQKDIDSAKAILEQMLMVDFPNKTLRSFISKELKRMKDGEKSV